MKLNFETPADNARIEILPLMDVIFCILTFFILGAVGLTRQQALTQNLPQASTGDSFMSQMLPVSIDAGGQIYLSRETQPISFQDLAARWLAISRLARMNRSCCMPTLALSTIASCKSSI